jgi:hypothetical protein
MANEVREYHHHELDRANGASVATIATIVIVLLILGFLLWGFLPARSGGTVNVNTSPTTGNTGGSGTGNTGGSY